MRNSAAFASDRSKAERHDPTGQIFTWLVVGENTLLTLGQDYWQAFLRPFALE
jgi:hypothetical protein